MMRKCVLLLVGLVLLIAASCGDGSCYDNSNSLPLVRFYASGGGQVTVSGVSLRGIDAPADSMLVKNQALSETYLPLRATRESTQWIIEVAAVGGSGSLSDTLTVDYKSIPYFASAECGAMYSFELKSVDITHHMIDSVVVMQPVVKNEAHETMRIYFKKQ